MEKIFQAFRDCRGRFFGKSARGEFDLNGAPDDLLGSVEPRNKNKPIKTR
jgi:hypothetical protein